MIAQLQVQNPDNTAGAESRWFDMLRIAITPTAQGTDFHAYVISVVLNIPQWRIQHGAQGAGAPPSALAQQYKISISVTTIVTHN